LLQKKEKSDELTDAAVFMIWDTPDSKLDVVQSSNFLRQLKQSEIFIRNLLSKLSIL
jgi:hypothetical protein